MTSASIPPEVLEKLNDAERELVAACSDLAYRARRGSLVIDPTIAGVVYGDLVACSACADIYPLWIEEARKKYAYVICTQHGLKYAGVLVRAARAIDDLPSEQRRRSGLTTHKWHEARGA